MEQLKGYVDHIIYKKEETGYHVFEFVCDEDYYICVGTIHGLEEGENYQLEGDFYKHNLYDMQFKVSSYERLTPEDAVALQRYLASGAVKGIGPAMATKVIERFGSDTLRIMEEEPERLAEIKGISLRKAREIAASLEEKKDMRDTMIYLQKFGISSTLSVRIYERYKDSVRSILRSNPYKMAEEVEGIGFRKADEIAREIGIHLDSEYRIHSGILFAIQQSIAEGNMFMLREELLEASAQLLELRSEQIESSIPNLMMERKIILCKEGDQEQIYAASHYYNELHTARMLHDLAATATFLPEMNTLQEIEQIALQQEIVLDESQKRAVLGAITSGVFVLSGGPGTGKTTTINVIIRYFEKKQMDFYLAAPTGRAAKRMAEATGFEAKTIHRLLEISPVIGNETEALFGRNESNPLEVDAVIIDEMSMVDAYLFQSLLRAILPGTLLILVGDVNQLPSVGPGQILRDIITSGHIKTVVLEQIYRQAQESDIIVNAHRINRGLLPEFRKESKDFFMMERDDLALVYQNLVKLMTDKLPRYLQTSPLEIQVLTPMRKGNLGAQNLNTILQKYLNPPQKGKTECVFGDSLFREGDKVMQVKNNYQLEWEILGNYGIPIDKGMGVFNGDIGKVLKILEKEQILEVEYEDARLVRYPYSALEELELAYAITIHKSQGSEYPAVIIPLLSGPQILLSRNLLYTGVTRARSLVVLLGSRDTVEQMVRNVRQNVRKTGLAKRIQEMHSTS